MAAVGQLRPLTEQLSMQERIYQELRQALLRGVFDSGERIYEAEIAQQLGVSRVPVREAVRRLQQDGLLEVKGRGGVYVASISIEEVDEVYRLRAAVEGVAAGLATERATATELDHIGLLVDRMASVPHDAGPQGQAGQETVSQELAGREAGGLVAGGEPAGKTESLVASRVESRSVHARRPSAAEGIVSVADEFHRAIHAAAKCDRVYQVLEPLYAQLMRFRRITLAIPGRSHEANDGHRQVYLALRGGDPDQAERLMREHIDSARRVLLAQLAEHR